MEEPGGGKGGGGQRLPGVDLPGEFFLQFPQALPGGRYLSQELNHLFVLGFSKLHNLSRERRWPLQAVAERKGTAGAGKNFLVIGASRLRPPPSGSGGFGETRQPKETPAPSLRLRATAKDEHSCAALGAPPSLARRARLGPFPPGLKAARPAGCSERAKGKGTIGLFLTLVTGRLVRNLCCPSGECNF